MLGKNDFHWWVHWACPNLRLRPWPIFSINTDWTCSTNTRTCRLEIRCTFSKPKTLQISKYCLRRNVHL